MIDYPQALKKGLGFCVEPKRWLPFFIIDSALFFVVLAAIRTNLPSVVYLIAGIQNASYLLSFMSLLLVLLFAFALWVLANIWINGALIHQSYKEKEFTKSWGISGRKYLSLLAVAIVSGFLAFAASLIPVVGWIISIILGLVFFFGMQSVIVKGNGMMKALEDTWHIFKRQPFKVFIMWILIAVMSLIIIVIFALPIIGLLLSLAINLTPAGEVGPEALMNILFALDSQLPMIAVTGLIVLVGLAISRAFAVKSQTEFYLQIKKK